MPTTTTETKKDATTAVHANGSSGTSTPEKDVLKIVMEGYGFTTPEQVKESPVYRKAFAEAGTKSGALKRMAMDKTERFHADGWFIRHDVFEVYNKEKSTKGKPVFEKKGEGPLVLLEDGTLKPIHNGQVLKLETMASVQVGPLERHTNLYLETDPRVNAIKDTTKVSESGHGKPFPQTALERYIDRAMGVNKKRGVIYGESEGSFGIFTIPMSDPDAIKYFPVTEKSFDKRDRVIVIAEDSPHEVVDKKTGKKRTVQNRVQFKIPVETLEMQMGIPVGQTDAETYKSILAGETFAASGKLGLFHPKSPKDFPDAAKVGDIIAELQEAGMLDTIGKAKDGTDLKGLKLAGKQMPNGEPVLFFEAQGFRIYDAQQDKETKDWQFSVLATEENKVPWMDIVPHPWGPNDKGQTGINNEGAFILFLAGRDGSKEDPFEKAAAMMPD